MAQKPYLFQYHFTISCISASIFSHHTPKRYIWFLRRYMEPIAIMTSRQRNCKNSEIVFFVLCSGSSSTAFSKASLIRAFVFFL